MSSENLVEPLPGRGRGNDLARMLAQYGIVVALGVVMLVASIAQSRFLTSSNLLNIANSVSIVGFVAIGMTFVVIAGRFVDLSVPATILASGTVTAALMPDTGVAVAVVGGLAAGACIGVVNGLLIGVLNANSVVVTIAAAFVVIGVAQALVQGEILYTHSPDFNELARGDVLGIPTVVVLVVGFGVIAHVIATRTVFGRWTFATGAGYEAARASGVPVRAVIAWTYVISALGAATAGILLLSLLGSVRAGVGDGYDFDAIGAVAIGGTSLLGGAGGIPATAIGIFFVGVLNNLMILLSVPSEVQGIMKGALIIGAVGLDVALRRRVAR